MKAGMAAPSGCNKQTTSFIAIDDDEVLNKLKSVIDPPIARTAPNAICVITKRENAYRDKCYAVQDYAAAIEASNRTHAVLNAIWDGREMSCFKTGMEINGIKDLHVREPLTDLTPAEKEQILSNLKTHFKIAESR